MKKNEKIENNWKKYMKKWKNKKKWEKKLRENTKLKKIEKIQEEKIFV